MATMLQTKTGYTLTAALVYIEMLRAEGFKDAHLTPDLTGAKYDRFGRLESGQDFYWTVSYTVRIADSPSEFADTITESESRMIEQFLSDTPMSDRQAIERDAIEREILDFQEIPNCG